MEKIEKRANGSEEMDWNWLRTAFVVIVICGDCWCNATGYVNYHYPKCSWVNTNLEAFTLLSYLFQPLVRHLPENIAMTHSTRCYLYTMNLFTGRRRKGFYGLQTRGVIDSLTPYSLASLISAECIAGMTTGNAKLSMTSPYFTYFNSLIKGNKVESKSVNIRCRVGANNSHHHC